MSLLLALLGFLALSQAAMVPQASNLFREFGLEAHQHPSPAQKARCQEKMAQHVEMLCGSQCDGEVISDACSSPMTDAEIASRCCPEKFWAPEPTRLPAKPKINQRPRCGRSLLKLIFALCGGTCEEDFPPAGFIERACSVGTSPEEVIAGCCPSRDNQLL